MKTHMTKLFIATEGTAKQLPLGLDRIRDSLKGIDCDVKLESLPSLKGEDNSRNKDLAVVILVSGAAIAAVVAALRPLLGPVLLARALRVKQQKLAVIRDKKGNPIKDKAGLPVYEVLSSTTIADPNKLAADSAISVDAQLLKIAEVKVSSGKSK